MKKVKRFLGKKVSLLDVIIFVAVYMGVSIGGHLLWACVIHGEPISPDIVAKGTVAGLGLMTGRIIVWMLEYGGRRIRRAWNRFMDAMLLDDDE